MAKPLRIRNSTAEFLIFTRQAGEQGIEVRLEDETVWLTQKLISVLFGKGRSTITEHLCNIFASGKGLFPVRGACNTATDWNVDLNFASGLTMKFASSPGPGRLTEELGREWTARYGKIIEHGTAFEGEAGWIVVDRERILTQPESLVDVETTPELLPTKLVRSADHVLNFLEAVRSRGTTVSPIEAAVQSDAFCHIADIALRLGRKLRYDGQAEKFIGDREANQRLQVRPMRKPWKV